MLLQADNEVAVQSLIHSLEIGPAAGGRRDDGESLLRSADDFVGARAISGHFRVDHHGGRQLFRGDEHDVCGRGAARKRSWDAARARIHKGSILFSFFLESLLLSLVAA